jgi:hypothetical protein
MYKYTIGMLFLFAICSLGSGKTIVADVTGDGVDDTITFGLKIVVVQDGASNKHHTVVAGIEFLADVMVDDFFNGTKGNEIAVLMLPEKSFLTEVYGYRNKRFIRVSRTLPGELTFDEDRRLFGYATHAWDRNEVMIYWPIVEREGYLQAAQIVEYAETTLVVAANETEEFPIDLEDNTFTMCVATIPDKNAIVFLMDEIGTLIKQTVIDPQTGFFGRVISETGRTVILGVDNSQSAKPKTIHLITKQYLYP